jgi:hypothetical protein
MTSSTHVSWAFGRRCARRAGNALYHDETETAAAAVREIRVMIMVKKGRRRRQEAAPV